MLIFFYGPDSYRINQKINEIKEKFTLANPDAFDIIDTLSQDIMPKTIKAQILAMPLFSKTRLVIFRDFISGAKEESHNELLSVIKNIPSSTNVIITEVFPDKRLKIYKTLLKEAKTQEFNLLDTKGLVNWIEAFLAECKIERTASMFMAENLGGNLWQISNILKKLETQLLNEASDKKIITLGMIEAEIKKISQNNSFNLVDAYLGNHNRSLTILRELIESGENPFYLISMIASGVRNLILIVDAIGQGKKTVAEIALYTKLKPFVVSKNLNLAKNHSTRDLIAMHNAILEADTLTKYGIIKPELALELLTVKGFDSSLTRQIMHFA